MTDNRQQLNDTANSGTETTGEGTKIVQTPETINLASELHDLEGALTGDRAISTEVLQDVAKAMDTITVDFFGDHLTIAQINAIPDAKEHVEIFKEIQSGNGERMAKLKYLPVKIAECLGQYPRPLILDGLTSLSDKAVEHLITHTMAVTLRGLKTISAIAFDALESNIKITIPENLKITS